MEEWRIVEDYPKYEVSNLGNVRNAKTMRVLKPLPYRGSYLYVVLNHQTTKHEKQCIHLLVANAFLPKQEGHHLVDHINREAHDNRACNLRYCTQSQNQFNRAKKPNSTSQYKGVSWYTRDRCWRANVKSNGTNITLGKFQSEEDAARAYDEAAKKIAGEFAFLNFPC